MRRYSRPDSSEYATLLARPAQDLTQLADPVRTILQQVRTEGDTALEAFTLRFDGVHLTDPRVPAEAIAAAAEKLDASLREAMQTARKNIMQFHLRQLQDLEPAETMPGVTCWRRNVGIEKVGLYIPGGTAPLLSTVLMLAIPARLAGCRDIVLCTPPRADGTVDPAILYAAQLTGVTQVFRVGGAQAIGAMAYGTESVPAVYKIFGPGNPYVTVAKQLVSLDGVAIDMPAGPSELLVIADTTADPTFVAADLLSQAEHGADSQVVLVSLDTDLTDRILQEVDNQLADLPRRDMAAAAMQNSVAIDVDTTNEALAISNAYAPEHLILAVDDPLTWADGIINAGSVFLGHYTPESVGDYASGTNHTLPTDGYARMYSGVSLDAFVKKITFQSLTPAGLQNLGPTVEVMAQAEQLEGHRRAVSLRLDKLNFV